MSAFKYYVKGASLTEAPFMLLNTSAGRYGFNSARPYVFLGATMAL